MGTCGLTVKLKQSPQGKCLISGPPTKASEGRQVNIIQQTSGKRRLISFIRGFQLNKRACGDDSQGDKRERTLWRACELEKNHMQTWMHICCVGNSCFETTCSSIFTTAWANSSERGLHRHLLLARTWCRLHFFTGILCDHVLWDKTVYFLSTLCLEVLLKQSANEAGTDPSFLNRLLLLCFEIELLA